MHHQKRQLAITYLLCSMTVLTYLCNHVMADQPTKSTKVRFELRSRDAHKKEQKVFPAQIKKVEWNPRETAIIICDMWDDHTCKAAAARVAEMAPKMNETVNVARQKGMFIIHAPSGKTSFYKSTPQRQQAIDAPLVKAPVKFKWNNRDQQKESNPLKFILAGGCGCQVPCDGWVPDKTGLRHWDYKKQKIPWTRQIKTIDIAKPDAISDNGQEIFNLLEQHQIKHVILMGVHTNLCVCGRPFGLRQMTYLKKDVVLCRDLTDSLFQSRIKNYDHFVGTEKIVQQIEADICPTILSTDITGEKPFVFKGAKQAP